MRDPAVSEVVVRGVEVIEPDPEAFTPREVVYVNTGEIELLRVNFQQGLPTLLIGPKGVGKTLALAYVAHVEKCPIVQLDCSEDTRHRHLIGQFVLVGDEVRYVLGAIPTAIAIANRVGKCILVFEEVNALTPQMQKLLNAILDWRQYVYIPEVGRRYELRSGAHLWVAATMNPYLGGILTLNEDLKSRFAVIEFPYPDPEKERRIVEANLSIEVDAKLWERYVVLLNESRRGTEYAISPRDSVQFFHILTAYQRAGVDLRNALRAALFQAFLNKIEDPDERRAAYRRAVQIFALE